MVVRLVDVVFQGLTVEQNAPMGTTIRQVLGQCKDPVNAHKLYLLALKFGANTDFEMDEADLKLVGDTVRQAPFGIIVTGQIEHFLLSQRG